MLHTATVRYVFCVLTLGLRKVGQTLLRCRYWEVGPAGFELVEKLGEKGSIMEPADHSSVSELGG